MNGREQLGKIVRDAWVAWASEQPGPKPSWLVTWDDLDDGQREVDMRIGEAVATWALFENAVTWNTDCTSCGRLLDQLYAAESATAVALEKRERIRQVIDRSKIEWMIHAFDLVDQLLVAKGMETSSEVQDDLRKLADLLDEPS